MRWKIRRQMLAEVSFGEWLKRRRSALGLTQEQLAIQINCSTSALRKFESEERRPSVEVVTQLAEIFNIPHEERKSFLRFTRGDWRAISSRDQEEAPWRVSSIDTETQIEPAIPRNNLPLQLTSFIGREKEETEIKDLVAKNRLVTLIGAGGIGKTRLSIQTASELLNEFPNGIWLVEFAPLSDPALIPQTIVSTLGLIEQENRPPQTVLVDFLQKKQVLLILDNCEHLIQACAQLTETLLHSCPDLHTLAVSREALGIPGETLYRVPPLTTPDPVNATLDTLSDYEAVQLFMERARSALTGFALTRENTHAIAQICHHLDGIPLAIELAVARVNLLRVEEIAARLDDRFRLLTSGARTALPRHQTLQALVDWSHDLLTEPERVLLRRLSVFAGGWTLEGAESVCVDLTPAPSPERREESATPSLRGKEVRGLGPMNILDLLTQLVNKSLILVEREQGKETRYRMLETIRQYAREKLWEAGEGELSRQQHLAYFVDLAERAEPNLRAFDMVIWLDRLESEHDNIRAALEWAQESDVEAQLRLASALLWFWHIRGHRNEGIDWLERGVSIEATEWGDQARTSSRAMIRGKALNASGTLLMNWSFEIRKAETRLEEGLALFRDLGPTGKQGMAYAILRLGQLPFSGNRARNMVEQSLTLFREVGDKFGAAECLMYLAGNPQTNDNFQLLVEEQLALSKEIGDQDGIAGAIWSLGDLAFIKDDYKRAIALYEESLASYRAVGNKGMVAIILSNLGRIVQVWGDYELASQRLTEALSMVEDLGMRGGFAFTLRRLGQLDWASGDYGQAAKKYEEALTLFRKTGYKDGIAGALYSVGKVAWVQGDYERAGRRYDELLALGREMENKFTITYALYGLGKVAEAKGDYTVARSNHVEALTIRRGLGNRRVIAYSLDALATLALIQQKAALAARLFGAAEDLQRLIHFTISPRERDEHDQAIAAARAALGEVAFSDAYDEGQKMTLDEAIALALNEH